jgi:CcmD family protein
VTTAIKRCLAMLVFTVICAGALPVSSLFAQEPKQQKEFLPASQLPPTEQFPAARLLVGAYSVVIVGLFLYVVSVARRLNTVQREVERLEADVKRTGRA